MTVERKPKRKDKEPETLGKRLKELREAAGLSQDELAVWLSLSRGAVSFYETDARTPNADTLAKLARMFNTTTDYLTGLSKAQTTDINIKAICDYTGLDERVVHDLHIISFLNTAKDAETNRLINALIRTCIEEGKND